MTAPDAVELTVDAVWFLAESLGAGTLPWVLAITGPQDRLDPERLREELTGMGVLSSRGVVHPAVGRWIRTVCAPQEWLELRYVRDGGAGVLRGLIARRADQIVVALRSGPLVTLSALHLGDAAFLAPAVTAPLRRCPPAKFTEFLLPLRVGARADARLRAGADVEAVLDQLGVPPSATAVMRSAFTGRKDYVEVRAGCARDGRHQLSEVGVGIVDTPAGRLLISPQQADDGTWLSSFAPGTPFAIAAALDRLTDILPAGRWFPSSALTRDFALHRT